MLENSKWKFILKCVYWEKKHWISDNNEKLENSFYYNVCRRKFYENFQPNCDLKQHVYEWCECDAQRICLNNFMHSCAISWRKDFRTLNVDGSVWTEHDNSFELTSFQWSLWFEFVQTSYSKRFKSTKWAPLTLVRSFQWRKKNSNKHLAMAWTCRTFLWSVSFNKHMCMFAHLHICLHWIDAFLFVVNCESFPSFYFNCLHFLLHFHSVTF